MPTKKMNDDASPAVKTTRKKKVDLETLIPDEADVQDDTINTAPVARKTHAKAAVKAALQEDLELDELEEDPSGTEIQLGVLTGQIEELTRVMASMAEKLDRIEAVVRSSSARNNSNTESREERPKRDFQPREDRGGERPQQRSFTSRSDSRGPSDRGGDRPQRSFERSSGDRPQRSFAPRGDSRGPSDRGGDRPQRSFSRDDRPSGDRPQRSFAPRGDSRGPSSDRGPARGNDSRGAGFSRGFEKSSSESRSFAPRTERPKFEGSSEPRGFGRRKDHGFGGVEVKRKEEE